MNQGPICLGCIHLNPTTGRNWTCKAFPSGIPSGIIHNETDHRHPVAGDRGIRFEPRDPSAEERAEEIFDEHEPVHNDTQRAAATEKKREQLKEAAKNRVGTRRG